jgi:superfamily II DNA/RNA helicase
MTLAKTRTTFQELGVSPDIIKALEENGFETPFPIQRAAVDAFYKILKTKHPIRRLNEEMGIGFITTLSPLG